MNLSNPLHWIAFYRILEQTQYCCKANWMHMKHLIISLDGSKPCSKNFNNSLKAISFKIARQLKFLKSFLFSPWDLSVCLFGSWSETLQPSSETKYYLLLSSFFWTFSFFLLLFLKLNTSLIIFSFIILYWKYFRSQFGLFGFLILSLEYNLKWKVCPSDGLTLTGELLQSWNLFSHLGGW